MKLNPIINSLLETDSYKFSMGQTNFHQFNKDKVVWSFKCRNEDVKFTPDMVHEIRDQIDHYCTLRFTEDELKWLEDNMPWITEDYIAFLRFWHPRRCEIFVNENNIQPYNKCGLAIEAHGTDVNTSFYEIAVLSIVSEVYYAFKYGVGHFNTEFIENTIHNFGKIIDGTYDIGTFSEFGLRRRYSSETEDFVVKYIVDKGIPGFVGTSNVFLAKKYGVRPIGTMAHQEFQLMMGHHEYNPAYVNRLVMNAWLKEYKTENGICLTDAITTKCFLLDFDKVFAKSFDGVRHDSGDPYAWGNMLIEHYKKLGIDPKTKTLLFSDSLDFEKATKIRAYFKDKARVAFGIGTFISNPLTSVKPLNIVMKLTEVNGGPVAKISDVDGKCMARNAEYVNYLKKCIEWRLRYEQ